LFCTWEEKNIYTKREKCDEALSIVGSFKEYHTKAGLLDDAGEKPVQTSR
jgi:hypothetical protein